MTDLEKFKEFLDSMNITYTEERIQSLKNDIYTELQINDKYILQTGSVNICFVNDRFQHFEGWSE